jgi:uncharacterized protein (TIGR00304 family)
MKLNRFLIIALLLLICGIALLGYSVSEGESSAGVFVIFPVLMGSGLWAFVGMMCIMGALLFGFMGFGARFAGFGELYPSEPGEQQRLGQNQRGGQPPGQRTGPAVKGGGVVLIGPVPIIFGSDIRLTIVLVILAIIIMFSMMFFLFYML